MPINIHNIILINNYDSNKISKKNHARLNQIEIAGLRK